jgi:hypothetical protein
VSEGVNDDAIVVTLLSYCLGLDLLPWSLVGEVIEAQHQPAAHPAGLEAPDLAGPGVGLGQLDDLEGVGPSVLGDPDGAHMPRPPGWVERDA